MLHIHRGQIQRKVPNLKGRFPVDFEDMHDEAFDIDKVDKALDTIREAVLAQNWQHLMRVARRDIRSEKGTVPVYLLGLDAEVRETEKALAAYTNYELESKGALNFGKGDPKGHPPSHNFGVDIERQVLISTRFGFLQFLMDLFHTPQEIIPETNAALSMGQPVIYYHHPHDELYPQATIQGLPEDDYQVTVQFQKKKKQVRLSQVLPRHLA